MKKRNDYNSVKKRNVDENEACSEYSA